MMTKIKIHTDRKKEYETIKEFKNRVIDNKSIFEIYKIDLFKEKVKSKKKYNK